ncbi:MAG: transposase, partial [Planctomycetes bacterium]|nr:transposase [Planctomycetota bacterium]
ITVSSHHAPRDGVRHAERAGYCGGWRSQFEQLEPRLQREFHETFSQRWHQELDNCHGACVLRRPELGQIVANSLNHFDGQRYELTDLVVMPNHVHLLAVFRDAGQMLDQCESWKHYTATQINRRLSRKGRFWQQDGFDHLVRSMEQFEYLRRYIADNPVKASLCPGEFVHESKTLK